ncbi:thiamine diphosphokinase [Mesorhizobium sp. NBSH29]|uniref:thiamine diphosphokinase n=1 Tax=Mesorhizobium sp. NBSH29 TaxID=2654249 RepID=UPI0018964788|nr:thiamine diphosphokinase [Mesorhizobium sp. NBSH29]QPC85946.1 thiamine diphosphokinase [Mesorhizobium sp. NBSH29]
MSLFTLLFGGDLVRTPRLDAQLAGSRVIAADSGIRHAAELGITPELWVGDFDSTTKELAQKFEAVPREVFPAEKDQTDGELAVDTALRLGATSLVIAGAFGGPRIDHTFLHLAIGMRLAEAGTPIVLTSGAQEGIPLLTGNATFDYAPGTMFSIIGFSALSGLTLTGVKWPLDEVKVPFGSSLTLSNEVSSKLSAELGSGRAMLIAHPFPGTEF